MDNLYSIKSWLEVQGFKFSSGEGYIHIGEIDLLKGVTISFYPKEGSKKNRLVIGLPLCMPKLEKRVMSLLVKFGEVEKVDVSYESSFHIGGCSANTIKEVILSLSSSNIAEELNTYEQPLSFELYSDMPKGLERNLRRYGKLVAQNNSYFHFYILYPKLGISYIDREKLIQKIEKISPTDLDIYRQWIEK